MKKLFVLSVITILFAGADRSHSLVRAADVVDNSAKQKLKNDQKLDLGGVLGLVPGLGGANKVVVRGWEVQALAAVKRPSLTQVIPNYEKRTAAGSRRVALGAKKGGFLVLLLQCRWATEQPPGELPWVGNPDITLVDDVGLEYAALGRLTQDSNDYVPRGMLAGTDRKKRRTAPGRTANVLVYFDVPATARAFWLRFGDMDSLIAVNQLSVLPQINAD